MSAVTTDALGLACEQALLFGRAKQAALERTNERQSPPPPPPTPGRFRVSSRVPLARLLFTICANGELVRMPRSDKLHPYVIYFDMLPARS